jgi:nuclear transport factor 2 (NTF2) superfamily protein
MSILNKNEQIRIDSVKQLEQVYEVLKGQWGKDYPVYEEIDTFNGNESIRYVYWYNGTVALFVQKYDFETITFDEFMSRVNSEPKTETTIIESTDGKKYEVIMVREVVEPMAFHEWFIKVSPDINFAHADCLDQAVEDYIQYRKTLEQ